MFYDQIQNRSDWSWCHNPGCAGGSGKGAYWMAQYQGSPSRTGPSTEFYNSGAWANALWWNKFGAQNRTHNFLSDFWIYLVGNSWNAAQALEYDVFQFVGGFIYMVGSQRVVGVGGWDTWDQSSGNWHHTSVPCPKF
jgi:hypothetical protein